MHSKGHAGMSLFLSAPILAVFLYFDYLLLGLFFVGSVTLMPMIPDIDIKLQKYFNFINHRGITHTVQFAVVFGLIYASVIGGILYYIIGVEYILTLIKPDSFIIILGVAFITGFSAILYHLIGDAFTPTGINFFSKSSEYGFTFDKFYAKNKVANESAIILGISGHLVTIASFYKWINEPLLLFSYLSIGYLLVLGVWLVFVTTFIGRVFYN